MWGITLVLRVKADVRFEVNLAVAVLSPERARVNLKDKITCRDRPSDNYPCRCHSSPTPAHPLPLSYTTTISSASLLTGSRVLEGQMASKELKTYTREEVEKVCNLSMVERLEELTGAVVQHNTPDDLVSSTALQYV